MIIFCYYHASYSLLNVLYVCCPIVGIIICIFYFRAPLIKYITTTDWVVYPFQHPSHNGAQRLKNPNMSSQRVFWPMTIIMSNVESICVPDQIVERFLSPHSAVTVRE